jgi:hypothetical protein
MSFLVETNKILSYLQQNHQGSNKRHCDAWSRWYTVSTIARKEFTLRQLLFYQAHFSIHHFKGAMFRFERLMGVHRMKYNGKKKKKKKRKSQNATKLRAAILNTS